MKYYENKGIKFIKTGGNSWLGMYNLSKSAIFVDYRDNYINVAKDDVEYERDEYETDGNIDYSLYTRMSTWERPSSFTSSEIEEGWIKGVVIVQANGLHLAGRWLPNWPPLLFLPFNYPTYKFQDNFGNIVDIEFDWFKEDGTEDWKVKSAIVRYP